MGTSSPAATGPGRFAGLFAGALDHLGDPRPHLRVGALHTLELLANEQPWHGPAVADVLCGYLRGSGAPVAPAPAGPDAPGRTVGVERSIRETAQRLLARHLRPGDSHWPGVTVDLTGAVVEELDLTGCRIGGGLVLDGATLLGPAWLRGLDVGGPVSARGTTFTSHAWLERSHFRAPVRFDAATFEGDAWLGEATFGGPAGFTGVSFAGHAWFGGCEFVGRVEFTEAVFRRSAGFRGAVLHDRAVLTGTTFLGPARVSRRGDHWNLTAPGWGTVVDPDNESVGQLQWLGNGSLIESTPV